MKIKKVNMADRANAAAESTPALADRFAHAQAMVNKNPAAIDRDAAPHPAPSATATPHNNAEAAVSGEQSTASPTAGMLVLVDTDQVDENPFNARRVYRPERIAELATSIGTNGQDTPGIATIRKGRYVLAAGHYRRKALIRLNKKMLLLIKPELNDRELYEISYRENKEREEQTTLDDALSWRQLLDDKVYESETDLSESTGISLPTINKTLATLKLKEAVLNVVREQPAQFGVSIAYELVLLQESADVDVVVDAAKAIVEGRLSRTGIQEIRSRYETPKPSRKPKQTSRIYKIQQEGASGSMKTWDSGKVSLEVTIADPEKRHALIAELQERFKLAD